MPLPRVVQTVGNGNTLGTNTSFTVTFSSSVSPRSTLIALFNLFNGGTVSSISSNGASWSRICNVTRNVGGTWYLEMWQAARSSGGASYQITGNFSSGVYVGMVAIEIESGGLASQSATSINNSSGSVLNGAAISAKNSGLHVAAMGYANAAKTISVGTGWTETIEFDERNDQGCLAVEQRISALNVSRTPNWNINWDGECLSVHAVIPDRADTKVYSNNLRPAIFTPGIGS